MSNSWVGKFGKAGGGSIELPAIADRTPLEGVYRKHWDEICRYVRKGAVSLTATCLR
jgi:hypothetical protein